MMKKYGNRYNQAAIESRSDTNDCTVDIGLCVIMPQYYIFGSAGRDSQNSLNLFSFI